MEQGQLAGYALLVGYGVMLLGLVRFFGARRIFLTLFGLLVVGLWAAIASLRVITARRI